MPEEELQLEDLPPEEREHVKRMLLKLMRMGIGAVYGEEDAEGGEALVDCEPRLERCRAACCAMNFALTKGEAEAGNIEHDAGRPFFIKRREDGYCSHLDRETLRCTVWALRPTYCRKYDCRSDSELEGAEWL
ncbi:MAG: YkgJ family cysteine cluster protein [Nitrospirota bacterium]|jgi:Fe-S-cluster containining protein